MTRKSRLWTKSPSISNGGWSVLNQSLRLRLLTFALWLMDSAAMVSCRVFLLQEQSISTKMILCYTPTVAWIRLEATIFVPASLRLIYWKEKIFDKQSNSNWRQFHLIKVLLLSGFINSLYLLCDKTIWFQQCKRQLTTEYFRNVYYQQLILQLIVYQLALTTHRYLIKVTRYHPTYGPLIVLPIRCIINHCSEIDEINANWFAY